MFRLPQKWGYFAVSGTENVSLTAGQTLPVRGDYDAKRVFRKK